MKEFFPDAGGCGRGKDASEPRASAPERARVAEVFPDSVLWSEDAAGGVDNDPLDAMTEARRRIQTDGVTAAVSALIDVCRDSKAPAPAKASAGAALLRAAGLFAQNDEGGAFGKSPSEMSAEELHAAMARLRRDLRAREEGQSRSSGGG